MPVYARYRALAGLLALFAAGWMPAEEVGEIEREDHYIEGGDPGIQLFLRQVCRSPCGEERRKVLLLHGARVPSEASFDLPVAGGSLAEDLAHAGLSVYLLDVRGYGRSTRPEAMTRPPKHGSTLVRTEVAIRDVGAAVEHLARRSPDGRVALLGWATGGHWAGSFASQMPTSVSHLVLYNTLSSGSDFHGVFGRGSPFDDPIDPGTFNHDRLPNYRLSRASSLFGLWNRSIPIRDKDVWRDPAIAEAYADAALASDSTSSDRDPPTFRSPSGAIEDAFELALGRPAWDLAAVRARVLVIASERDYWSRPSDRTYLVDGLVNAAAVREVLIPSATHFVHLDRPERGRDTFLEAVTAFLTTETAAAPAARLDSSVLDDVLREAERPRSGAAVDGRSPRDRPPIAAERPAPR